MKWEQEKQQFSVEQKETEETPEQMEWEKREILEADAEVPKKERRKGQKEKGSRKITKVEDLFSRQEGGDRAEKTDT